MQVDVSDEEEISGSREALRGIHLHLGEGASWVSNAHKRPCPDPQNHELYIKWQKED